MKQSGNKVFNRPCIFRKGRHRDFLFVYLHDGDLCKNKFSKLEAVTTTAANESKAIYVPSDNTI